MLWPARLHACVFWFNPLAWWVARQLAALAEQTSDEAAVETLGNPADWGDLMKFYPPEAMHKDVEGMVELAITLDSASRATDTRVLTEDPLNMGFGAAASAAAHIMQYSNPTGNPVTFTVRVKFALNHSPPTNETTSTATSGGH